MAMPASGSIAIISAPQTCGSICAAIGCASGDLATLSIVAGKTAPYTMTAFYSYTNTYKQIGFSNIESIGTNNTICRCSVDCICSNTAMVAGQCYTITLCHQICANACTGSLGCVQVLGVSVPYCCAILNGGIGVNFSCSFVVKQGDAVCIINEARHPINGCHGVCCSCAHSCITSVSATLGLFCKTTGCSDCVVYACS